MLYDGAERANVLVTSGSAEANYIAIMTILDPGDEIIYMTPNYLQIKGLPGNIGVNVKELLLEEV